MPAPADPAVLDRSLAAFAALLIAFVTALNFVFIPFHAPDDIDHFERADMLAFGEIWPETQPGVHSGGKVDAALQRYVAQERPAIFDWPRAGGLSAPIGPDPAARDAKWTGEAAFTSFNAAAITYLPVIYLPQTIAIWVGKALDLSIETTIRLARELNGLVAIGIASAALALWPLPAAIILVLAFLPKTMLHLASNSPDPIYDAAVIGIVGLVCQAARPAGPRGSWRYLALAIAFLIIGPVRPPAAALALPVFWLAWRERAWAGASLVVVALAVSAAWTLTILTSTVTDACADDHIPIATKILAFLRDSAWLIPRTLAERGAYFLTSGIGELGWGRGPEGATDALPSWVYALASGMLVLAAAVDMSTRFSIPRTLRGAFGVAAGFMIVIIFLALYVTCSSYLQPVVRGIQGRYFVPVLICLVPVLAGVLAPRPVWRRLYEAGLFGSALAWFAMLLSEGLRIYWMR